MVYCCFHLILASLNPSSFVCYTHVRIYYQNSFGWKKPPFCGHVWCIVMWKKFWAVHEYTYAWMDKTNSWLSTWALWAKCHKVPHLGLELVPNAWKFASMAPLVRNKWNRLLSLLSSFSNAALTLFGCSIWRSESSNNLFTYGFLACCLSNILFAKKKHIKQSLEWYPLQGLVSLKECLSWWKKSKQQDSLFGSQNSAIVTKPTRRMPLKSHFFHSTRLDAHTHSPLWPKRKPGWQNVYRSEDLYRPLVNLQQIGFLCTVHKTVYIEL